MKDKAEDKCKAAFCRNLVYYEYRSTPKGLKLIAHQTCSKCRARRWRSNNPLKAAFKDLRASAKRRKIPFTLTLQQFSDLCEGTTYLENRGCLGNLLQVDRKDPCRGYEAGNLQIITCSENVAKGNRERHYPEYIKSLAGRNAPSEELEDELCPF